ncbi:hypothetical protein [Angustibacter aerolatus]|uniref:Uncharacterized protein n=1 Tax=Angustibacter aerolatus TaxID=1162965 RepID=A0ABQ6JKJ9_9ACTN|nr:hypothetical protein [Angustibacter aerolatus]GMA87933.1 hypothetical protein GCM10025868_31830 [Angustibacter aerolatus]
MWVFLSGRLRQWALFAVVVPAVLGALRVVRRQIERRSGPNGLTRGLARVDDLAGRVPGVRRR